VPKAPALPDDPSAASRDAQPVSRAPQVPLILDASLVDVLDAIRLGGAGSRHEIGQLTGLGRNVVTQRVGELIAAGLVADRGLGRSTGGRPPRQLSFRAQAGHLLVGFIGATSLDVAVVDAQAGISARRSEPIEIADGPDVVLRRLEALFDEVRADGRPAGALWGVGIGLPGPVEFSTGRPVAPPIMPGWDRYPVRDRISRRFHVPVWVDNDVNLLALGEWRHGEALGHRNVIFVKIGTGIGAGLISDGQLHRGTQGSAGDVGHVQVTDDPLVVCRCGNTGCLEAVAGGAALARDAELAARDGRSPWLAEVLERNGRLTARDLSDGAVRGDPASIELLQRCGHSVGLMLAAMVNFFNPSLIVVGGGVAEAGDLLLASVRQVVYGRSLPLATRTLDLRPSSLGDDGGILGVATMVLDELFSRDVLPMWIGRRPSVLLEPLAADG
jgi:glucokinase-like ROK family protein